MPDSLLNLMELSVFTYKPDWSTQPERGHEQSRTIFGEPFGLNDVYSTTERLRTITSYSFTNMEKSDEYNIVKFFNDRKGRWGAFWLPVWKNSFTLETAVTAGDMLLVTEENYFSNVNQGIERIFLELSDGSLITRQVTQVFNNYDGTQSLILVTAMDRNIAIADVVWFGFLRLVRFSEDELKISSINTELSTTNLQFVELVQEYRGTGEGDS